MRMASTVPRSCGGGSARSWRASARRTSSLHDGSYSPCTCSRRRAGRRPRPPWGKKTRGCRRPRPLRGGGAPGTAPATTPCAASTPWPRAPSLVGWPPHSPAVLAHLNAGAGSPPLTRCSRSTTTRPVCGCPRLAHGGRVRRPRSGPRGGRRRPRQSLLPWEPVADAERMRSDGDAGGAGESGAWPGRRRGTRPASGCPW